MSTCLFNQQTIEEISRILGEETKGYKITTMLGTLQLYDMDKNSGLPLSTKWKRINAAIIEYQNLHHSGEALIKIAEWIMNPVNYINESKNYPEILENINNVLCFSSFQINDSGKIIPAAKIDSYTEGKNRCKSIKKVLEPFEIHPQILAACRPEILDENYFHLIFESAKLVLNKVQEISQLQSDGNRLIGEAFDGCNPLVIRNTLQTEDEQSEHKGLKALLNSIVCFYRNPKAHSLKVYSPTKELDAVTALISISSALKMLDNCSRNSTR